jgi:multiple sugar transport system permease protein/raffinose/stachyose/melibiose transport system permease protein
MQLAGAASVPASVARPSPVRRRRFRVGAGPVEAWIYVLPALALFALFELYPIFANIVASLHGGHGPLSIDQFSIDQYRTAAADPVFWVAVRNSLVWVVLSVAAEIAIGFPLALLIELYIGRGRPLFRTILFLPMVVTPSVIALVFTTIYAPDYGLLFGLFNWLGLAGSFPALLGSPFWATPTLISVNVWQWCGFFVLLYCVGIAGLDRELLDAAAIDGATGFARIRYVIWPLLRSTHVSLIVLGTIQALQQFPLIYLMTEGGPANQSQTLATFIFQTGFVENRMGYASAIAVVLFVLALVLVAVEYWLAGGGLPIGEQRRA